MNVFKKVFLLFKDLCLKHFLAYSPFSPADHQFVINTSPSKILSRILEPRSLISSANSVYAKSTSTNRGSTPPSKVEHCMLSGLAVLRTDENENISELNLAGIRRKSNKNNIVYVSNSKIIIL